MFPPRNKHPTASTALTLSSVKYLGARDPASTTDINRRAREKGVIDLTSRPKAEYSVPEGKRTKIIQTQNLSNYSITLQTRWNQGAFRWVHKGQYAPDPRVPDHDGGPQNGELCVSKEFKTGSVYEEHFFDKDIRAVDKANEIIMAFNKVAFYSMPSDDGKKPIYLTRPTVWEDVYPDSSGKKSKTLVEPMLEGDFIKFNSNSGYSDGADFMQALSHYSYYITNGKFLLCDLQGGHYSDCYILTDPVIMSADNSKEYGSGDLGKEGIDNFFAHHCCNRFCQKHWWKPVQPRVSDRIPCSKSTSLSLTLGTVKSEAERLRTLNAILKKEPR